MGGPTGRVWGLSRTRRRPPVDPLSIRSGADLRRRDAADQRIHDRLHAVHERKAKDDVVFKIVDTLAKTKPDLVAVAPHLSSFNPAALYKRFDMPYHPGALKYFADHNMRPVEIR